VSVADAVQAYHHLLEADPALARASAAVLADQQGPRHLTFGGRALCKTLRPQLIARSQYAEIQRVCHLLAQAMFRLGRQMLDEPALLAEIDPTDGERRLLTPHPGYQEVSPTSRLDSFVSGGSWQFVEYNAESPAAIAYEDGLADLFLGLPVMRRFQEAHTVAPLYARHRLVEALRDTYAQFQRSYPQAAVAPESPTIAIVDWSNLPTATEFELFRAYFEQQGLRAVIVEPAALDYDGRRLRAEGLEVDLVYRRVLTSELLMRPHDAEALIRAYEDGHVCVVNSFRAKLLHKKMTFALLSDDRYQHRFTAEQWAICQRHIPWTRKVREGYTTYNGGRVDLLDFVAHNRHTLVLKPNDDYGGKGVVIGWETSDDAWSAALAGALSDSFVVQERVAVTKEPYPLYDLETGSLSFADLAADLDPFLFNTEVTGVLTRLSSAALLNVTAGAGSTAPTFVLEGV